MFDESSMRVSHVTIVLYNIAKLFISRDCRQLVIWCGQDNRVDKHDHVFMPPPLGAGGIMFSGCPSVRQSVRSLKYPLLTCTWVRWSTRPTETVLQHVRPSVCPSVRPERFPGICRRTHGGNGLKFYMLMYLDHLQNWAVYGRGLLIFLILALFWLSETGQIWGFRAFPGERIEKMAWNLARWCILATFRTD